MFHINSVKNKKKNETQKDYASLKLMVKLSCLNLWICASCKRVARFARTTGRAYFEL